MSYQVLARKWRPQTFHELVGQSHVKQALVNALTQNRLHHAYLFTGTRGVGKTTIARIFAKSLNCDEGISAQPCGQCSSCKDIESGRYIDLLEIDAASRTKVEDTREILDNVQYAPTRGRYKVYLIDEVHMLSKHSFNALLKTLEEPPEHVKFLLATTDPQKLPVTILSRCLQFNLNALSQTEILQQLEYVLNEEQLSFDTQALQIIAKAADGSMRDALSLTDQAIAQTNGNIQHQSVQNMLGLMDNHYSQHLLAALLAQDGASLLAQIEQIASQNPQYTALLDDLIALTHLIQLTQLVPDAAKLDDYNSEFVREVAQASNSKQIQIYYQLLLNGKKDLQWAPEPRLGFEMIMLRLLAFEPTGTTAEPMPSTNTQPVQNNQGRASALRDIINKNKPVPNSSVSANTVQPVKNDAKPAENTHVESSSAASTEVANNPADDGLEQPVQPIPTAEVSAKSHNTEQVNIDEAQQQSQDDAYQQYSDTEQTLATQFDDVMSSAIEQGFSAEAANTSEPEAHNLATDATVSIAEQESQAQSAIARILRDRNISGAGKLSGANISAEPTPNQSVSQPDENESKSDTSHTTTTQTSPVSMVEPQQIDAPPWSSETGQSAKKPALPATGSETRANSQLETKKVDFKEKHQTITENLAPELLEQINPQKKPEVIEQEPSVPVPDDFQSPISEIRFAHQQDEWAYLIKRMGLGGRMRQFALHSIFSKQGNNLHIDVDESQKHLDTPMLRQKLDAALSSIYEHNVTLSINFAQGVIDSPYLIQQKIDAGRHQQAIDVITSDENIVQFQQLFSAIIDENSIQAL
ncbi:DNA polymerase III subunit gamma/tau [Pseudoalteromonas shioyasakiensis]|uniref:DNA polymerase III subunit gamma/tau n=1 Tax=Pseudoalteromonas shioyasakiensis TaxID=1190813 RepID=UPI00211910F6|nr:DNA polymerase III subunit gamma/tau [Pseudoalteromonas shioyasakiensis]MCQ8877603.1 DNA polymerase III subunit gamma/tau [Pseudoalteromonas shioyasakiensis]